MSVAVLLYLFFFRYSLFRSIRCFFILYEVYVYAPYFIIRCDVNLKFQGKNMERLSTKSRVTVSDNTQVVSVPETVVAYTRHYTVLQQPTKAPTPECTNFTFNILPNLPAELLLRQSTLLVDFQVRLLLLRKLR